MRKYPGPIQRTLLSALIVVLCLPLTKAARTMIAERDRTRDGPAWQTRNAILARARVFVDDEAAIAARDLSLPPNDSHPFDPAAPFECRYVPKPIKGTTPKFDCQLPDGEIVKVKYGHTPERHGEVAATRILAGLGFGADRVQFIEHLRCHGCPPQPFRLRQILDLFYAARLTDVLVNYDHHRDYEWVTVERKLPGEAVEVGGAEGWGWFDLPRVQAAAGGASAAELDALRLMALLIVHWDNKEANQRLLCLNERAAGDEAIPSCREPLLMLQDVGATFGPTKVNFDAWNETPVWRDAAACALSMDDMPHGGGTFTPIRVSEAGRQTLARRLSRLTDAQVRAAFLAARFPHPGGPSSGARDVSPWVDLFKRKVREIVERPACPQ